MNHEFEWIGKMDADHYVVRCNRGQLHLICRNVTLHLSPAEFADLALFLGRARHNLRPGGYCGNTLHFVMVCEHRACAENHCLTWLQGVGLRLAQSEFMNLAALVLNAQRRLDTGSVAALTAPTTPATPAVNYVTMVDDAYLFINWRQSTFALCPAHFMAAVDFLRTAHCRLFWCDEYSDGDRWLQRDECGCYQLWLYGVGFYLTAVDLQKFMELCECAAERLAELQPAAKPQRRQTSTLHTVTDYGFSIN